MPTGFQVLNDSSTYQVDETYKNFQLSNAGSGTTSSLYSDGSYSYYYYDYTITNAVNPILAVYCANRYVTVTAITKSGSTWTFRVVSGFNNASVELYVFDVVTTSPHNYGLQIFNASAELVYHSGNKPLRIVALIDNSGTTTYTYTSGRKYATVILAPGFSQDGTTIEKAVKREWTYYSGVQNTSQHVIVFSNGAIQISDITSYTYDPPFTFPVDFAQGLVVDITNF